MFPAVEAAGITSSTGGECFEGNYSFNLYKHQYSETNVMHFLFSLLRMKDLYMFRALLAHPQEVLYK
jgi:hypothetical protein